LALADAGVELNDLVTSCTVAVMADPEATNKHTLLADPVLDEMNRAQSLSTLAVLANWKEVTLWDQESKDNVGIPANVANDAISLAQDGCRTMHRFMRQCLVEAKQNSTKDGLLGSSR